MRGAALHDLHVDFGFAGGSVIHRAFFEVKAGSASLASLSLHEGRAKQLFAGPELLAMRVVPYDRFAIWMHCYRQELSRKEFSRQELRP
jgi:hypothetical protein